MHYVKLEDWYLEINSHEDGKLLCERRGFIGGRMIRVQGVSDEIYKIEQDKVIGFDGGRTVLMTGIMPDADSNDIKRFLLGYTVQNVVIVKDEKGRPAGKAIVTLDSEAEAHRATLEKHRKYFRVAPVLLSVLS
jgi:hypothetical protein